MEEACEMPAYNTVPEEIKGILATNKTIAVVGLSPKEDRASNRVARYLHGQGYKIIPVNPYNNSAAIRIDGAVAGTDIAGWRFDTGTGVFQADDSPDHAMF